MTVAVLDMHDFEMSYTTVTLHMQKLTVIIHSSDIANSIKLAIYFHEQSNYKRFKDLQQMQIFYHSSLCSHPEEKMIQACWEGYQIFQRKLHL